MHSALSALLNSADSESILDRAYTEALGQAADADEVSIRLLDAARTLFSRLGIRRCTMEDVARQAGLSRITAYRRFATKQTLVEQVVRREFRRYFDQFLLDIREAATVADRVVLGFVSSLRAFRRNPLIGGLIATEPDRIMPSMINDSGRTLAAVSQFTAGQLRREQQAGHIRAELDVDLIAEMMVRIATSFLSTPSHTVDLDDEAQLADLARRFLVPMLESVPERT
ncbi:TetR/AcrR family transcriptional regulator [Sciscionella marina]|uniref:TetR/AcrR family transcriptional regulator n=1 Tax=Sciscionella marina TaxID=508770 RepID=UPI000369F130|nr:TetR/AcrR family transcriptional regulator [Sciscionella marina]